MRDLREQNWNIYAIISRKKIWIRSAGLYMERMDLNIRNPHFAINDADNWYRGNDPRAIITYRGAPLW